MGGTQHIPFLKKSNDNGVVEKLLRPLFNEKFGKEKAEKVLPKQQPEKKPLSLDLTNLDSQDKTELANAMAYYYWLAKVVPAALDNMWKKVQPLFEHTRSLVLDFGGGRPFPAPVKGSSEAQSSQSAGKSWKDTIDEKIQELIQRFTKVCGEYQGAKEKLNIELSGMHGKLKTFCNKHGVTPPQEDEVRNKLITMAYNHGQLMQQAETEEAKASARQQTQGATSTILTAWFGASVATVGFVGEVVTAIISPHAQQVFQHYTKMQDCERQKDAILAEFNKLRQLLDVQQYPDLSKLITSSQQQQQQSMQPAMSHISR